MIMGDLHRETKSKKVVKPKFTTDFPGAVIREGADELTPLAHEESMLRIFIKTTNVRDQRWEPPQVDAEFHRESKDQSRTPCTTHKDLHHAVKSKKSGENKKAKVLWAMNEAKDRGEDYHDTNRRQEEIQTKDQFRLNLWASHQKSLTAWQKRWSVWTRVRGHHLQRVSGESRTFKVMSSKTSPCQAEACLLTWKKRGGMAAGTALVGTAISTVGPRARKSAKWTRGVCDKFGEGLAGKGFGFTWILGMF